MVLERFQAGGQGQGPYTKPQLNAFKNLVGSIASNAGSKAKLTAKFHQTPNEISAEISLDTSSSSKAMATIDVEYRELEAKERGAKERGADGF